MISEKTIDKLNEGMKYLDEVKQVSELSYEQLIGDFYNYRTAERLLEVISQVIIDVCTQISASVGAETPDTYASCFDILRRKEVIDKNLAEAMSDMARMRNLVAHRYGSINYKVLHKALEQITYDYPNYRNQIISWYQSKSS